MKRRTLVIVSIFLIVSIAGLSQIFRKSMITNSKENLKDKIENKNNFSKRFRIVNNSWNNIYNERSSNLFSLLNFKCKSNKTSTLSTNTTRYQIPIRRSFNRSNA